MHESTVTTYTIYRLLGHGGYGKVYQAMATEPNGEKRVVALKLVDPAHLSEAALAGLRDEARLAHLLDDPAVVDVQPPFLLEGLWAVEMEFVDGASLHRLLKDHGRVPARAAAQLVAEVLRALERLALQPGPSGLPLALVHRDLKPGNVQLTPAGQVKVLDFGSAIVAGLDRETPESSSEAVVGTRGYIAPERFDGIDVAKGDVYALGSLLHHLITGALPGSSEETPRLPMEASDVLEVAEQMRAREMDERCDASTARERLNELAATMSGPSLRRWTAGARPVPLGLPGDELVGRTLHTTEHEMPLFGSTGRAKTVEPVIPVEDDGVLSEVGRRPKLVAPPPRRRRWWLLVLPIALAMALGCGLGLGGLIAWSGG